MQQEKVKKLKINVTNLRSALVDANKTLGEISAEKKSLLEKQIQQQKIKEKEEKLTTKRSPLQKAGDTVKKAAKSVMGFFEKVIQFGATILIGQLITALPVRFLKTDGISFGLLTQSPKVNESPTKTNSISLFFHSSPGLLNPYLSVSISDQ